MGIFDTTYDVIIIGGGISGLFLAYKLGGIGINILLFEEGEKLGGRIHTIKRGGVTYEAGAARFHKSHTKVLTLIDELGLMDKIIDIPDGKDHYLRGYFNNDKNYHNHQLDDKLEFDKLLRKSFEMKDRVSEEELRNINFFQYLGMIYGFETAEYIKDSFGYDSEFMSLNAEAAMTMFKDDFIFNDHSYYLLNGGLSQIIECMEKKINQYPNVRIIKNCKVLHIKDTYIETKNDKFYYEKLICAIPQKSLKDYKIFDNLNEINNVECIPLLRIYVKYPKGSSWFKDIKRTITNNHIRHIIPIDYENGLIMISYSDGNHTRGWENLYNNGEEFLINVINKEIFRIFGVKPPKHEFLTFHLWECGVHFWKPGSSINEDYLKMLKPFKNREIYVCGETYSKKQGWMEGAISTCYDIIQLIDLCDIEVHTDIDYEKIIEYSELEEYVIDDVLKRDDWIIIEDNNLRLIFDISKWIGQHPGGNIILKGIEANQYYKDKRANPESPTMMFHKIHSHNKSNVFENFFRKRHKLVKLVGILK